MASCIGKPRIRQNQWDNWYGYRGTRRVVLFTNSCTETAEQAAQKWLERATAEWRAQKSVPTAHQLARAIVSTTERYRQGKIVQSTWKKHVTHLLARAQQLNLNDQVSRELQKCLST